MSFTLIKAVKITPTQFSGYKAELVNSVNSDRFIDFLALSFSVTQIIPGEERKKSLSFLFKYVNY